MILHLKNLYGSNMCVGLGVDCDLNAHKLLFKTDS